MQRTRPHRVLVVDDSPDIADILTHLFETLGWDTASALCGRDAVRVAGAFDPDLVLLDLVLPDLSGFDVLATLREASGGRERFIVAMTGWSRPDSQRRATESGFDAFLVKPIDLSTIRDVLRLYEARLSVPSTPTHE